MTFSRVFIHKLLGYIAVGGIAAMVDATCFYIARYQIGVFYLWALVCGFIPGVTTNFLLCHRMLFYKYKRTFVGAWFRHLLSSTLSFTANAAFMLMLIEVVHIHNHLIARILAIGFGFIISFDCIRYYAFQDDKFYILR